jgi:hypothetical protein
MACAVQYDRNAEADAIIAFMPELRTQMAEAMALALFDAVLNGDTASTHQDSLSAWAPEGVFPVATPSGGTMVGSALDHRRAFLGLRARAFDIGSGAKSDLASSYTFAKIQGMQAKMSGGVGQNNARVAIFASFENILNRFSTLAEVLTLEKFGPAATILTGEVGRIGGHPLILSEFMDKELNASGIFDNSTKTKTGMCIVNLARFVMARLRSLRVEVETVVREHTHYVVASERKTLHTFDGSSTKNAAFLYNLSV